MLADWIQTKCSLRFQVNLRDLTCKKWPNLGVSCPTRSPKSWIKIPLLYQCDDPFLKEALLFDVMLNSCSGYL